MGAVIAYISYDGLFEPLVQSQVVPYLLDMASKTQYSFVLLTFDKRHMLPSQKEQDSVRTYLKEKGIIWYSLPYHNTPSLLATAYDIIKGTALIRKLIQNYDIKILHARSYVAGMIALRIKKDLGIPFVFDMRGVLPEERVDSGHWSRKGIAYKIAKKYEKQLFISADSVFVLSEKGASLLRKRPELTGKKGRIFSITTAIDKQVFSFNEKKRELIRKKNNWKDRFVVIYSGSVSTWYLLPDMISFFKEVKKENRNALFLVLTREKDQAFSILSKQLGKDDFIIRTIDHSEMPDYLSASDLAVSFIKPSFSKKFSCPTKIGEYFSTGLVVVANSGIGDINQLFAKAKNGVLVHSFSKEEFAQASKKAMHLAKQGRKADAYATNFFSIEQVTERYMSSYTLLCGLRA